MFDEEFQDWIENKIKSYYNKALLRDAYSLNKKSMVRYNAKADIQAHKVVIPTKENKLNIELFFTIQIVDINQLKAKKAAISKIQNKVEEKKRERIERKNLSKAPSFMDNNYNN